MQDSRMYSHLPHAMDPMALYSSSTFVSEQRLAEDVRFLHSLWHLGPPENRKRGGNTPPVAEEEYEEDEEEEEEEEGEDEEEEEEYSSDSGEEFESTDSESESQPEKKKLRVGKSDRKTAEFPSGETLDYPEVNDVSNWNPYPWESEKPSTQAEWTSATQKSEGILLTEEEERQLAQLRLQNRATRAFKEFLSKSGDGDSEDDTEDDDDDCVPSGAHAREVSARGFFERLFVRDEELRRYYEQNCNCGAFECLVCAAVGAKAGKKFPDCVSLVQHATKIMKTKKLAAHRGYGRAICTMLGWDSDRLPSITKPSSIMAPRGCIPPPDEVKVQGPVEGDNTNKTEAVEADKANKTESAEGENTNKTESGLEAAASDNSDNDNVEDEEPAASDNSDTDNVEDEEPASE